MKHNFSILCIVVLIMSCGSKKRVVSNKDKKTNTTEQVVIASPKTVQTPTNPKSGTTPSAPRAKTSVDTYIATYAEIAKSQMRTSKIPASITLAQGILESGSGNGRLAVEANNHFGIKCHGWTGKKIYHDDDKRQECFRKYTKAETSYKDHSEFLTGRKRYAKLFRLRPDDYKGWARGLKAAGYATDSRYPQKLISLIERYQLYNYDKEVLGKSVKSPTTSVSKSFIHHIVVKGDTLYAISKRYGVSVATIKSNNNLTSNTLAIGQELKIKSK